MTEPADPVFRQGAGRLCLDFIRTLRHRGTDHADEELPTPADLAAWITQCGPCPATPADVPEGALTTAHELREQIHALIETARTEPRGGGVGGEAAGDGANRPA